MQLVIVGCKVGVDLFTALNQGTNARVFTTKNKGAFVFPPGQPQT